MQQRKRKKSVTSVQDGKVMKGKEKPMLTSRQLQVLPHLLTSPSYEEAARRSRITSKQIHTWLKDPQFQGYLREQQTSIFCEAMAFLKTGTQNAVRTLISLLDHPDPRVRLGAADKILVNAFKGIEFLEIEERLSALEDLSVNTAQISSFGAKT